VIESGLPGYDVTSWNGIAAPKGTSEDIVFVLNREVTEALKSPDVQKFANSAGMDARGLDSQDLEKRIKSDVQSWSQLIAKAGIERR
jgi:tripartite-type tricarboxylate transporter receptor subunit TctC